MLNDKLSGSFDYYIKETSDLLASVPPLAGTNFTNFILTNVGSMKNEGFEMNLNLGLLNTPTTKIDLGLNATYNKKIHIFWAFQFPQRFSLYFMNLLRLFLTILAMAIVSA